MAAPASHMLIGLTDWWASWFQSYGQCRLGSSWQQQQDPRIGKNPNNEFVDKFSLIIGEGDPLLPNCQSLLIPYWGVYSTWVVILRIFIYSELWLTFADVAASCSAELCNQAPTFQNIMKNFCQADFGKLKKPKMSHHHFLKWVSFLQWPKSSLKRPKGNDWLVAKPNQFTNCGAALAKKWKNFKNPNCIWRQMMNAARIGSRAIPKRQDFWSWGKSQKIKVKVWCQLLSFLGQETK